ncbi:MAG: hypothetical protein KA886_02900 [Candidatus Cloacimonetes bacterium]|nr:hypothetical protein [Candidatus Cloacimonadota bacterium]
MKLNDKFWCFLLLFLISTCLNAQSENEVIHDLALFEKNSSYIENWVDKPIFINLLSEEELVDLGLFNEDEVRQILIKRKQNQIKSISDFNFIKNKEKIEQLRHLLVYDLRTPNQFQSKITYTFNHDKDHYFYNKNSWHSKQIKMAFLTEKDPDDTRFPDLMKYSLSYRLTGPSNIGIQEIFTGSYSIQTANSILFSASLFDNKRQNQSLNRAKITSNVNRSEYAYLNGLSAKLNLNKLLLIPFYSSSPIWIRKDSLNQIVSINKTGLHADRDEEKDHVTAYGMIADMKFHSMVTGIQFLHQGYPRNFADHRIERNYQTFSQYSQMYYNPFLFRYELAYAKHKIATHTELSWQKEIFYCKTGYRQYPEYFPENYGNPYSQRADFRNEKGMYYLFNARFSRFKIEFQTDLFQYSEPESNQSYSKRGNENYLKLNYSLSPQTEMMIKTLYRVSDVIYEQEMIQLKRKSVSLSLIFKEQPFLTHQTTLHLLNDRYQNDTYDKNGIALLQKLQVINKKLSISISNGVFKTKNSVYLPLYTQTDLINSVSLNKSGYLIIVDASVKIQKNITLSSMVYMKNSDKKYDKIAFNLAYTN